MNKEYAVQSINKIGKIGYIIAKICRIVLMIGAIGCLIGAIVMVTLPDDLFNGKVSGTGTVEISLEGAGPGMDTDNIPQSVLDDFKMNISSDEYIGGEPVISADGKHITVPVIGGEKTVTPNRLAILLGLTTLFLAACVVVAFFIEKLCKEFRDCSTPFSQGIITAMERFAWSIIPWAIVRTFTNGFIETAFNEHMDIRLGMNLSMILAVLLVFGLAKIFKYGAVLQQESDETL